MSDQKFVPAHPDKPCPICYTPMRLVNGVYTCPRPHKTKEPK